MVWHWRFTDDYTLQIFHNKDLFWEIDNDCYLMPEQQSKIVQEFIKEYKKEID